MITRLVNPDAVQHVAKGALATINPVTSAPSTPLEMASFIDSFGVSLMPRTSAMQGVVAGLNILAARLIARAVEAGHDQVVSPQATLSASLAVRALVGGAGTALERLPEREDETLWRAGARSAGNISAGGRHRRSHLRRRHLPPAPLSRPPPQPADGAHGSGARRSRLLGVKTDHRPPPRPSSRGRYPRSTSLVLRWLPPPWSPESGQASARRLSAAAT